MKYSLFHENSAALHFWCYTLSLSYKDLYYTLMLVSLGQKITRKMVGMKILKDIVLLIFGLKILKINKLWTS